MRKLSSNGSIILIFVITLPFLLLLVTIFARLSLVSFQVARSDELHTKAQFAADAGADYAIEQIVQDNNWNTTSGEKPLHSDPTSRTTFAATVANISSDTKRITVTGRTYYPASSISAKQKVVIAVDIRSVTSGSFSVVSGAGGLTMSNTAKIVGGNVLINGEVTLANSAQIGLSTTPLDIKVAGQSCPKPADATYPRVCNPGETNQPITMSNNSRIYGTVTANNQSNGTNMSNPGLVTGSVTPQALPTYDRAAQKAAATTTLTAAAASCGGTQSIIWPANVKITGNVTVGNKCNVTVKGNVWITGSLVMTQSGQLTVDSSLGSTQPVIMVDGSDGLSMGNGAAMASNASKTGFKVITFHSTAPCSPDCTSVTGTDAYNSRSFTTITLNNSGASPDTVFYSYWTKLQIQQSGSIGAIIGQTLDVSNSGTITFGGTGAAGNYVWVVKGYRRL